MNELYIGLMSGTSADGLDGCLVHFDHRQPQVLAHYHRPYTDELKKAVITAMGSTDLVTAADLDVLLAEEAVKVVDQLQRSAEVRTSQIVAIGSHGQTLFHHPDGERSTSIQVSDPHRLAVRCGIDVVADFRRADIAAGGQGAPLAPGFHSWLFRSPQEDRAVLNIGGMANLTVLPAAGGTVRGFDTGPGNVLLDLWSMRTANAPFDHDGSQASRGRVHEALLACCLQDPYFALPPPKSTGREHFNADWLEQRRCECGLDDTEPPDDIQATLAELTATSITESLHQEQGDAITRVLVCGGGARNRDLMARLSRHLPSARVESTERHGLPPEQVEAVAFAWLARERIARRPGNIPSVTGATRSLVLGAHIAAPR